MGRTIEADYLVVGAGAMGMAFTDTMVGGTNATVVMVDRNDQPGGHWTMAYPFVRLHQPPAYYGVNSRNLGSDTIDEGGLNAGYYELASGAEVCAYYDSVMRQQLLPTGRVTYLPMSEYLGDGRVSPIASRHRCFAATTSPCRRCARANPRSARRPSLMSKRRTPTTKPGTRSAARCPIRANRPTGCE
jgi:hypothetical protein